MAAIDVGDFEEVHRLEVGGTVAFLVDRTFGTWSENYSTPRGIMMGSPKRDRRPALEERGKYKIEFAFLDGRSISVSRDFDARTPILEVAAELARALKSEGLSISSVPEFGAFRLEFTEQLCQVVISGPDGLTAESHIGRRADLLRDGIVLSGL